MVFSLLHRIEFRTSAPKASGSKHFCNPMYSLSTQFTPTIKLKQNKLFIYLKDPQLLSLLGHTLRPLVDCTLNPPLKSSDRNPDMPGFLSMIGKHCNCGKRSLIQYEKCASCHLQVFCAHSVSVSNL